MTANVESMAYHGEVPWHGLGVSVPEPMTSAEAIKLAGLDWEVTKQDMYTEQGEEIKGHKLTMRMSDRQQLGVVGEGYQIIQNSEAFTFMDDLVTNQRLIQYHTAGALDSGRKIWMLAKVHGLTCEPVPGDVVEPYLLLCSGHDGSLGLTTMWTSVRVVCQNTLSMALSGGGAKHSVRHTGDMASRMKVAQGVLKLTVESTSKFEERFKALALKKMGDKVIDDFFLQLVPDPAEGVDPTRAQNIRQQLRLLHDSGAGAEIPGVQGSAWGVLQAVTDYASHERTVRGGKGDPKLQQEKRLESLWFGSAKLMGQKALELLENV